MVYGYARVSTLLQSKGNGLEDQEIQLINAGCEKIIKEVRSGTKKDRPEFAKLLQELKPEDTLVVTKLDRFARTTIEGVQLVESLLKNNIKVRILNIGFIEDTPMGRLILTIMLAFAEFEKDLIFERTMSGRELARRNPDYRDGRPKKYNRKQINHALELLENHTYKEVTELTGISKSTLIRAKNEKEKNI